jgi:tRNA1Val (adenine37-N6)-methyltransferase
LRGRLRLWQPRDGYRFAVDPLLLVDFVGAPVGQACDLGAGCGVIALALARADGDARVTAVELQPRLAALARRNAVDNGLAERVTVVEADLAHRRAARGALPGAAFDLAVSNPPFRPLGEGSANPVDESAIARHELRLTLGALTAEMRRVLRPGGRAVVIYPAERLTALLGALDGAGLRPRRLRLVHARANEPARRALVEARKGQRGHLTVEPPLVLYGDDGAYSAEARRALGEG